MKVIGIDEAGRGAWAGPIVAAAVYFRKPICHRWLKDSKLLTPAQREVMCALLVKHCAIGIGVLSNKFIDRHGLQLANVRVIEKAFEKLVTSNQKLVIRGSLITNSQLLMTKLVIDHVGGFSKYTKLNQSYSLHKHGESKFPEIAAASVIAKVYRDRLMVKAHARFPKYYFNQHKGYGTVLHQRQLKTHGTSVIHRTSFAPIRVLVA